MRKLSLLTMVIVLAAASTSLAQGPGAEPVEPFKVGTFDIHGVPPVSYTHLTLPTTPYV